MPLKRCSEGGKDGWKWGDSGKCYTGPDAKRQAIRQAIAIEGAENVHQMLSKEKTGIFNSLLEWVDSFKSCIATQIEDTMSDLTVSISSSPDSITTDVVTDVHKEDVEIHANEGTTAVDFIIVSKNTILQDGLVYGIVYEPLVKDLQGDWTTPEEIEVAAHEFLPNAMLNVHHAQDLEAQDAFVVESYIAPVDFQFPSGLPVRKGSWVLVTKVNNLELRDLISKGEITGYSLEGTAVSS